jgi:hypothetical protein
MMIIKILGYHYTVETDKDARYVSSTGSMDGNKQLIRIASDINIENKQSTLIHEIIEALSYHLDLKLEHSVIMAFEAGFFQILTDNGVDLSPLLGGLEDGA